MDKSVDRRLSSWVLVYGNVNPRENVTNAFHLDCSREPIEEITQQDLSLSGSDTESDKSTDTSDGISIISESEIPLEENSGTFINHLEIEDVQGAQFIENRISCTNPLCIEPLEGYDNQWDWKKILTPLNLVSAGVVVSAVLVALYSSKYLGHDESVVFFDTDGIPNNFNEIIEKTISCSYGKNERSSLEVEVIKQCVRRHLKGQYNSDIGVENIVTDPIIQFNDIKGKIKTKECKCIHDKNKEHKYLKNKQDYRDYSGEWYNNMHKHRAQLRKDWVKHNEQWFIKRGNARQQIRHNKKYRAYSD